MNLNLVKNLFLLFMVIGVIESAILRHRIVKSKDLERELKEEVAKERKKNEMLLHRHLSIFHSGTVAADADTDTVAVLYLGPDCRYSC